MEKTNNNDFAILALVAIVAVIGVVSLVMMMNVAPKNVAMTDGTIAGQAFGLRAASIPTKTIAIKDDALVDDNGLGDGLDMLPAGYVCTVEGNLPQSETEIGHCCEGSSEGPMQGGEITCSKNSNWNSLYCDNVVDGNCIDN